jgi:hypothetical protein
MVDEMRRAFFQTPEKRGFRWLFGKEEKTATEGFKDRNLPHEKINVRSPL